MFKVQGKYSEAVIYTDNCEETAVGQILELCNLEAFKNSKIRIMPDCHAGAGCVIGFTANMGEKVVPNLIGVDIGCGMRTIRLSDKNIDLEKMDAVIRKYVPSGMTAHPKVMSNFPRMKELYCYAELKNINRLENSIGTLGGGNHFIEVDKDDEGNLYLIIHTGSRNLGKQVADYYQKLAIREHKTGGEKLKKEREAVIKKLTAEHREHEISEVLKGISIPKEKIPNALCYLEGELREKYLHDMGICQEYAIENRKVIADIIIEKMRLSAEEAFETIHNYIEHGANMIRKGAISAKKGEKLLIPINMRDGCIIGMGKGNPEWNFSAPHGAGRLMSRGKAKTEITMTEFENSMEGIYTTSVTTATLDEAPQAYKPMDEILENIQDSVEVLKIIRPIYNFKAGE